MSPGAIQNVMSLKQTFLALTVLLGLAALLNAAEPGHETAAEGASAHAAHAGPPVSPAAPTLFKVGPLEITNSIFYTWIIGALILVVVRTGTKKMK